MLDGVRLELYEWPLIPPYLEIEGDTAAERVGAQILDFTEDQLTGEYTMTVYARYGIELGRIRELRFSR